MVSTFLNKLQVLNAIYDKRFTTIGRHFVICIKLKIRMQLTQLYVGIGLLLHMEISSMTA